MELLGDVGQMEAHFGLFKIELILTQNRCTVCDEHAIGLKIVLGAPDGNPRRCGSSGRSLRFTWRWC
jgi:hypothetical protein